METATALTKPNSFNINDYMPTIDYDNHTVTANGGITFGNGSTKLDDFHVTSSSNEQYLVDGKKNYWLTNGLKRSGWVRVSGRTGGYGVVVGDVVVKIILMSAVILPAVTANVPLLLMVILL